jgi:magnesium transporter
MFLSVIAAVFISTVFPFLFKAFKWDPAFAAGPFATMVSDIATMMIYFLVASVLIKNPSLLT